MGIDFFARAYRAKTKVVERLLRGVVSGRQPQSLYGPCKYILEGKGKRLRPFLVLVSAQAVGGRYQDVYRAAVAFEMAHDFSLAHDDIMDNSEKRRGRLTLHKKFGTSMAILAGDVLLVLAYERLLSNCTEKNAKEVIATFTSGAIKVAEGQSLDMEFETRKKISLQEYRRMIYKKTAAVTEVCCLVGAQLCGATRREKEALARYGKYLGMAYQIQDDLLDIIGDERMTGKKLGSDLAEGKKTYLYLRAFEKAKGRDKELLRKVTRKEKVRRRDILDYRDLYMRLGVLKDAKIEIERYIRLAVQQIAPLKENDGIRTMKKLAKTLLGRVR